MTNPTNNDRDVTAQVETGGNYDEFLSLKRCVCGHTFEFWDFNLNIYRNMARACPSCKRRLYFGTTISVFEVVDD